MTQPAQLQIQCAFKGMDASDAVKGYATEKASKLVKYSSHIMNCHFVFLVEKDEHVAQLHAVAGEFEARAEARAENMYAAIDEVTDKLSHQARKYNEKHKAHAGKPHHNRE